MSCSSSIRFFATRNSPKRIRSKPAAVSALACDLVRLCTFHQPVPSPWNLAWNPRFWDPDFQEKMRRRLTWPRRRVGLSGAYRHPHGDRSATILAPMAHDPSPRVAAPAPAQEAAGRARGAARHAAPAPRCGAPHPAGTPMGLPRGARPAPGGAGASGQPGELVDWDGEFVGRGLFDGESAISVRVLTRNPTRRSGRRSCAPGSARRSPCGALHGLRGGAGVRLVHGESDGLPALFVDRYADYLVCQIYAGAARAWWSRCTARWSTS